MKQASFESPVTGRLTVYNLHNFLDLAEGFVSGDPNALRDALNDEYYAQGIDAICNEVKIISHPVATWIQVDNWIPTAAEATASLIASIIMAVAAVIIIIVTGALAILTVGPSIHGWIMEQKYPSLYFTLPDPVTGQINGPWPREKAYSWDTVNYPHLYFDPTTLTALDPSDPDFEEHRDWVILNTPAGWGEPQNGGVDIQGMIMWIVLGAVVIGGIFLLGPPLVKMITQKD